MSRRTKTILTISVSLVVLLLTAFGGLLHLQTTYVHQHCIEAAARGFSTYADDHAGAFPVHTNGFGDALLLLIKDDTLNIRHITGPGDDGKVFADALQTGADVPEAECSRIYIQGLNNQSNPGLFLLFDKNSTPGGDHQRWFWGKRIREVLTVGGVVDYISDDKWPRMVTNQVRLLTESGFDQATIHKYYPP